MLIRPYRPEDRPALDEICIRTADAGGDATGSYDDPGILPVLFAAPYATLEPEYAFVLDDGERAVGYVVATGDTDRFVQRFRDEWLPTVTGTYPPLDGERDGSDQFMRYLLHWPERMINPALGEYPAHLHIDVLPPHQGQGYGRALINRLFEAFRETKVPAVHLGMLTVNTPARAFYDRLGFHVIDVPDSGDLTYLGMRM